MISDNTQGETKAVQGDNISFGEKLKTTRETMGLSAQEVAARLNLSPRFIHLMEMEDLFHSSLPSIYLRGYLRSYSKILNIPEREINAILDKLNPAPIITPAEAVPADSLSPSFPFENNFYFPRSGTVFIGLILFASVTAWWCLHGNSTANSTTIAINQPTIVSPDTLENNLTSLDKKDNSLNAKNIVISDSNNVEHSEVTPSAITLPAKPQLASGKPSPKLKPEQDDGDEQPVDEHE